MRVGIVAAIAVAQADDHVRFKFIDTTQQPSTSCGPCAATTATQGHWQMQDARVVQMQEQSSERAKIAPAAESSSCSTLAPPVKAPPKKPAKIACSAYVDCSGHGSTIDEDRSDGCDCKCYAGYTGNDCHTPPPCSDMDDCSGHGTTRDLDKTDGCQCTCKNGFSGRDCSVKQHSVRNYKHVEMNCALLCDDVHDCSGHGTTTDEDKSDGCDCKCEGGYTGENCGVPPPPPPPRCEAMDEDGCSGHGTTEDLDKTDGCQCTCLDGWTGDNCGQQIPLGFWALWWRWIFVLIVCKLLAACCACAVVRRRSKSAPGQHGKPTPQPHGLKPQASGLEHSITSAKPTPQPAGGTASTATKPTPPAAKPAPPKPTPPAAKPATAPAAKPATAPGTVVKPAASNGARRRRCGCRKIWIPVPVPFCGRDGEEATGTPHKQPASSAAKPGTASSAAKQTAH